MKDKAMRIFMTIPEPSTEPTLKSIFNKLENEIDLTTPEVEKLLYVIECDNSSLFEIICSIHHVLDTGTQSDIHSLATAVKQWDNENYKGMTQRYLTRRLNP